MIPASELAALQAAAALALDTTANIERESISGSDGYGQQTLTWPAIATGVAAGLATPSAPLLQQYADYIGTFQAWVVKFAEGQDVKEKDRVVINGMTLTVQAQLAPHSYQTLTRVLAVKVS